MYPITFETAYFGAMRADEACEKYALTADGSSTGLATFRAIAGKYPGRNPKEILPALATSSGEPGRWFAAAKDAGFLHLALQFANDGRTDPRTLSRASRDLLQQDARCDGYLRVTPKLGVASQARADVLALAGKQPGSAFGDVLIRQCSHDGLQPSEPREEAATRDRRTWTRRSPTGY